MSLATITVGSIVLLTSSFAVGNGKNFWFFQKFFIAFLFFHPNQSMRA
jgi:hypothetical protein